MSFKELRNLKETPEQQRKAAEGFEERLSEHERRFVEQERVLTPKGNFYQRMFGNS